MTILQQIHRDRGIERQTKRKGDENELVKLQFVQNRGLLEKNVYFYGYVQYCVICELQFLFMLFTPGFVSLRAVGLRFFSK